ncbi:MAG TPA: hypothetical protein DEV87_02625 [Clostridiales bacterium]|nr:hypothetical protein [Clostridiales bacterium]
MKELREIIGKNLTTLRLESKMTQAELAEKLNYTDKSVSKWENGDAMPPVDTLKSLADLYGVTLDYLVTENPDEGFRDNIYSAKENNLNKLIITLLATSLVWLIATLLYVYAISLAGISFWQVFIYAVPVTAIVLIVFNGIWGKRIFTFILISVLVWTILLSVYIFFLENNPWAIFIIGVPLQIATVLWMQLKPKRKPNRNK